jgi:hypothetical protein
MRFAILAHASVIALTSVGLTACDDPVPPTAQGAWSVSFQAQDLMPAQCGVAGHNSIIGSVTDHTKEKLIANGTSEAGPTESSDLECSVVGKDKFDVFAKMTQQDRGLSIKINGITAAATEMSPAQGTASYSSAMTAVPYTSPATTPCSFYFIPNTGEGIAPGRIWVAFKCPAVEDSSTGSKCQIKQGFAIFENCTQNAAAE